MIQQPQYNFLVLLIGNLFRKTIYTLFDQLSVLTASKSRTALKLKLGLLMGHNNNPLDWSWSCSLDSRDLHCSNTSTIRGPSSGSYMSSKVATAAILLAIKHLDPKLLGPRISLCILKINHLSWTNKNLTRGYFLYPYIVIISVCIGLFRPLLVFLNVLLVTHGPHFSWSLHANVLRTLFDRISSSGRYVLPT